MWEKFKIEETINGKYFQYHIHYLQTLLWKIFNKQ